MSISITAETTAAVDEAIVSRRSVRAFLPTPVPRDQIEAILRVSSRAPSGTNTQPWKVHVLIGEPKTQLSAKIRAAYDDPAQRAQHAAARLDGTCTACLASARPTRPACTSSTAATTSSSVRRWA